MPKRKIKKRRISSISLVLLFVITIVCVYFAYTIIYANDIRWNKLQESLKDIKYPEQQDTLVRRYS